MHLPRKTTSRVLPSLALAAPVVLALTNEASAHVKWFCAYDVAGQPRGLETVLCPDFEWLVAVALVCLMGGCLAEGTPLGTALMNALDRVTARVRTDTELLVRATLASSSSRSGASAAPSSRRN